jgi:hypothetical protein
MRMCSLISFFAPSEPIAAPSRKMNTPSEIQSAMRMRRTVFSSFETRAAHGQEQHAPPAQAEAVGAVAAGADAVSVM